MKKLVIIGAGGFGREVAWLVDRINAISPSWELLGFIDADFQKHGNKYGKYCVLGDFSFFDLLDEPVWCVCAIGNAKIRQKIVSEVRNYANVRFATLIDPSVLMCDRSRIGEGSIICAGTILTVDFTVGNHVIINLECTVGHDAIIHDYVTVYPNVNISGNVIIGPCTELGTGSKIIQGLSISSEIILGAGAVVSKNLYDSGTYVGVPARRIK